MRPSRITQGDHSLRLACERGRMFEPSASMRNRDTKACGRQHRKRALTRVEMNAKRAIGQRAGIVVVERPVGQLLQAAPVGVDGHQMPVRFPTRDRALVGPVGEIDSLAIEIGHGVAGDTVAGVEQCGHLGPADGSSRLATRGISSIAHTPAWLKLRVQDVAVVVRGMVWVTFDEEDPAQPLQVRIAEHQPALGDAGVAIE